MSAVSRCLLVASLMLAVPHAVAQDVIELSLVNRTGGALLDLFMAPADSQAWGPDLLRDVILDDGATARLSVPSPTNSCRWDLKIRDKDGREILWQDLDVCSARTFVLFEDGGRAWVEPQ
jgi:hypothetical protein